MNAYTPERDLLPVAQHTATWHDVARDRDVPIRAYFPAGRPDCAPLVVFSHGLGSSRDGYSYLGRHWAGQGYVAVHVTHYGTDTSALHDHEGRAARSVEDFLADAQLRVDRSNDVRFVLDALPRDATLSSRIDFDRIGVAGHSAGSFTALTLVGLTFNMPGREGVSFADERVRAAITMSPQSAGKLGLHADSWSRIDRPVIALTGTKDREHGVGSAELRRMGFDRTPGPDQYLFTIDEATHATFDDYHELRIATKPPNPAHHGMILAVTTAFLDAYLRESPAARQWLTSGAPERLSGGRGEFEHKRVTPFQGNQVDR